MIADQVRVLDGFDSLAGGQDAGKRPSLIGTDQASRIENASVRGGSIHTRPAFMNRTLTFTNNITYDETGGHGGANPVGSQTAFTTGIYQGCKYFDSAIAEDVIIVSVGGRLFSCDPERDTVEVMEIYLDKMNRANVPVCYMVQADRFLIVQDGESKAIIYDGVNARRALDDEIPVGTIMAYGMGRIVLIGSNKRDILFGDLYGSHPGEPGESVLKFTETTFLTEGGAASLPFSLGHIVGAIFYPQQDTSMGQGQLLVFAEKGMASFFLSLPRDQWKTSQFQVLGLIDIGGRGHRAFTPVNGDVWFRSGDGWRAYRQARAEAKGWFQLPLSTEVGNYVDVETQWLLNYASAIRFDNRLIATCTPYPNQLHPYHNGLVVLDFDVLSSFGEAKKPSWEGHWFGLKTLELTEGNFEDVHRAFAFALDANGHNAIYEITDDVADSDGPISFTVDTRAFNFQQPFNEDKVYDADLWLDGVKTSTTIEAWFKPDQYPSWIPWRTAGTTPIASVAPISNVGFIAQIPTYGEGFFPRRSLGKPPYSTDTATTKRDVKRGYEFQVRLKVTGNASISRFRLMNKPETEVSTAKL